MTFDEFWDALEHFNWFYYQTDDLLKWQNGERKYYLLEQETVENPELHKVWLDWHGFAYDGKPRPQKEEYVP